MLATDYKIDCKNIPKEKPCFLRKNLSKKLANITIEIEKSEKLQFNLKAIFIKEVLSVISCMYQVCLTLYSGKKKMLRNRWRPS